MCVSALVLAVADVFVGWLLIDAMLVLVLAGLALAAWGWIAARLRAPAANPFELWARRRGLPHAPEGELPEATPLLCRGTGRRASDVVTGALAPDLAGTLARYTYVIEGREETRSYEYTVVVTRVPESVAFAPSVLYRHARSARGHDDLSEETYADRQRVELESGALSDGYEIETWSDQDPLWVRELFSPSFVAWLSERAPDRMSFEVSDGALCVSLPGHDRQPDELDALVAAAEHVARRLRDEALEEEGRAATSSVPVERGRAGTRLAARVERVRWSDPPPDAVAAARRYRAVAAREPGLWLQSLLGGGVVAAALFVGGLEDSDAVGNVVVSGGIGVAAFLAALWGSIRQRARRYGREAFVREYARSRGLELRSGRRFHAEHLRLPLPGTAEHALRGRLHDAGVRGELVLATDRTNRRHPVHYAALVAGVAPVDGVPWLRLRSSVPAGTFSALRSLDARTRLGALAQIGRMALRRPAPRGTLPAAADVGAGDGTRLPELEPRLQGRYIATAAPDADPAAVERLLPADVTSALLDEGYGGLSVALWGGELVVFAEAPAPDARSAADLDRFCAEAGCVAQSLERAAAHAAGSGRGLASA